MAERTDEEKTAVALAMLDGMADLWFAESGFAICNFPEPIVRAIKQAHHEGLYKGRCSAIDEPPLVKARPLSEWHEDHGPVLWWFFPVSEAPWVGSPGDSDWLDDYYTHWTPLPALPIQPPT